VIRDYEVSVWRCVRTRDDSPRAGDSAQMSFVNVPLQEVTFSTPELRYRQQHF
jgi:hypothetical protein